MHISKILFCLISLSLLAPSLAFFKDFTIVGGGNPLTQTQYWFQNQTLDHFNPRDNRTFQQRYWVEPQYFLPSKGNVLFYICGESTCAGIRNSSYVIQVAAATQSLIVVLEHRYYGLSLPFGNDSLTTDSLAYLSVEQALADCANFIGWFKGNHSNYNLPINSKWVVIGGSYAGALSAWFRLKYPHLVIGSWSSSGVVNAISNFEAYDFQIWASTNKSGAACPATIQNLTTFVENNLYNNGSQWAKLFKGQFGSDAAQLTNEEFLSYFCDVFASQVQYGQRVEMCGNLTAPSTFVGVWNATLKLFNQSGIPAITYSAAFTSNSTWDINYSANRLWLYQVCSQFGWFQTAFNDSKYSLRSKYVNISFYEQFCDEAFGIPLWPDVWDINNEFGGRNIASTNTIMINGIEDPWQWASNTDSKNPSVTSYVANCNDCAHCVDLRGPSVSDSANLTSVRVKILNNITSWFANSNPRNEYVTLEI